MVEFVFGVSTERLILMSEIEKLQARIKELEKICSRLEKRPVKPGLNLIKLQDRFDDFNLGRDILEKRYNIKLELTHDLTNPDCYVWANSKMVRSITYLLIENAVKSQASLVRVHYQENPATVQIVFADNGRGMGPCGRCSRITVEQEASVETVEALIQHAGGHVSWESRLGIGTWVTILLRKDRAVYIDPDQTLRWKLPVIHDSKD